MGFGGGGGGGGGGKRQNMQVPSQPRSSHHATGRVPRPSNGEDFVPTVFSFRNQERLNAYPAMHMQ